MYTEEKEVFEIGLIRSEADARAAIELLNSEFSFDDRNFTPGEVSYMQTCTLESLKRDDFYYWYAKDEKGNMIGMAGIKQNPQKTGGYVGDYCVVHRAYRSKGIALKMHEVMFRHLKEIGARYLIIETCDTPPYRSMRKLLDLMGFRQIGYCADYYFKGEGLIWYWKGFE